MGRKLEFDCKTERKIFAVSFSFPKTFLRRELELGESGAY